MFGLLTNLEGMGPVGVPKEIEKKRNLLIALQPPPLLIILIMIKLIQNLPLNLLNLTANNGLQRKVMVWIF